MTLRQRMPREKDNKHLDYIGHRSGRLQVVGYVGPIANTTLWRVRCDCGTEKIVRRSNLSSVKSCGCLRREHMAAVSSTHGLTKPGQHHRLYGIWNGMVRRCHGSKPSKRYGQRGIYVCSRWRIGDGAKSGFECFLEDMGNRPSSQHSLDRKDNDGPYSPENCRWAMPIEQQRNKSSNRVIEFDGRQMTMTEAIHLSGLKEGTVWARLAKGWTADKALLTPAVARRQS